MTNKAVFYGEAIAHGTQEQMTSYRSELGEIEAGLGVLGTFVRSGLILIRLETLICDNSAAVLARKFDLTPHVCRQTESDYDFIAAIKYLEK
jgi:hypothetical protein